MPLLSWLCVYLIWAQHLPLITINNAMAVWIACVNTDWIVSNAAIST